MKNRFLNKVNKFVNIVLVFLLYFHIGFYVTATSESITHTTKADFAKGTVATTLEINQTSGDIKLKKGVDTLTDTTTADFESGVSRFVGTGSNEVKLKDYYSFDSTKGGENLYNTIWEDTSNGLLYLGSDNDGLFVYDLNDIFDASDDQLVAHYNTSSTPALPSNKIRNFRYDASWDYFYIGSESGLVVIDRDGTSVQTDDSIITTYTTLSSPSLPNNVTYQTYRDSSGVLYISTPTGFKTINTQNTASVLDDTSIFTYTSGSSPALVGNNDIKFVIDGDYLYIAAYGTGLSVIDTKGTVTAADDENVGNYNTGSTPALVSNNVRTIALDTNTDTLYVGTQIGLDAIDRNSTPGDMSDDTKLITYNSSSAPTLGFSDNWSPNSAWVYGLTVDQTNSLIYVSTPHNGVVVINTHSTTSVADDTIVEYSPTYGYGEEFYIFASVFIDSVNDVLFTGTYSGALLISLDGKYMKNSTYESTPRLISDTPIEALKFSPENGTLTSTSIQYRTGNSDAYWTDDFDDGDESNVTDKYGWGGPFNSVIESDGVVTMSDPEGLSYADMVVDSGLAANSFPAGSVIVAKIRSNTASNSTQMYMYSDEWEFDDASTLKTDEWTYVELAPTKAFSTIGFEIVNDGNMAAEDSFQIDWVKVVKIDSEWEDWSSECTNQYGCDIDSDDLVGNTWIQYRLNLGSTSTSQTPVFNDVSYIAGYQSSGKYRSSVIDAEKKSSWATLVPDQEIPTDTSITYYTRSGPTSSVTSKWSEWETLVSGTNIQSPDNRYLQYKAILTTTDEDVTPVIHSITINHDTDTYDPTGSIIINNDETQTSDTSVTLSLTAEDDISDIVSMKICNNSSFTSCSWRDYEESIDWELTDDLGTKEVFVKYKDESGNISDTYSDTIELIAVVSDDNSSGGSDEDDGTTSPEPTPNDTDTGNDGGTDNSPPETPATKQILIVDAEYNPLKNESVVVNGQLYTTDSNGRVNISGVLSSNTIEFVKNGKTYKSTFSENVSTVTLEYQSKGSFNYSILGLILLVIIVLGIVGYGYYKKKKLE